MEHDTLIKYAYKQGITNAFATVVFDMQHQIIQVSPAFAATMGYAVDDLVGRYHEELCDAAYVASPEYKIFWDDLAAGITFQNRIIRKSATNHKIFLEALYYPVKDEMERVVAVIKFCLDISKRTKTLHDAIDMMTTIASDLQGMAQSGDQQITTLQNDIQQITKFATENQTTSLELLHQTQQAHKIINVISDIAYQTRMLAINTAIEAARLEQKGSSFAVISAEIRKLSTQVQTEAISIQKRIDLIATNVDTITQDSKNVLTQSEEALATVNVNTTTYTSLHEKAEIMRTEMENLAIIQNISNIRNQKK